jgi:hypothetical protein
MRTFDIVHRWKEQNYIYKTVWMKLRFFLFSTFEKNKILVRTLASSQDHSTFKGYLH